MPNTGHAGVYIGVSGRDTYLLLAETAIYRDFFVFLSTLISWFSRTRAFRIKQNSAESHDRKVYAQYSLSHYSLSIGRL